MKEAMVVAILSWEDGDVVDEDALGDAVARGARFFRYWENGSDMTNLLAFDREVSAERGFALARAWWDENVSGVRSCACGEWPVEEYGERCPSCPRSHRFAEGDLVRHVDTIDAPENRCRVLARTWRAGYPAYSLVSALDSSDRVDDVLDTDDLVAVS